MTNLDDLPDEITLIILGYLTLSDLQNLSELSTRFFKICDDARLNERMFIAERPTTSDVLKILEKHRNIVRELHFFRRTDMGKLLEGVIWKCENLRTIRVNECREKSNLFTNAIPLKYFQKVFLRCQFLKNLEITYSIVKKNVNLVLNLETYRWKHNVIRGWNWIALNVSKNTSVLKCPHFAIGYNNSCENLKSLSVYSGILWTNNDFSRLDTIKTLQRIRFDHLWQVSGDAFLSFFDNQQAKNFAKLSFHRCINFDGDVIRKIANSCPNLEKFCFDDFNKNGTSDVTKDVILELFERCEKLKFVRLLHVDKTVADIFSDIPHLGLVDLREIQFSVVKGRVRSTKKYLIRLCEKITPILPDFVATYIPRTTYKFGTPKRSGFISIKRKS